VLLRLAMEKGADPDATAPASCDVQKFWFLEKRGQRKETKSIVFAGKSAFQCLLAAERAIKMTDAVDWKEDLEAIDEAIEILSSSNYHVNSVAVSEGVIETWENVMSDSESADVVIKVEATDDADSVDVRAHGPVLRGASPVRRAMLSATGMREGAHKQIQVKDCSIQALRLLLSLVYTGMAPSCMGDDPISASALLAALDLAHRWQVLHVVQMLASALQRHIDLDSFEAIMDVALRFQLPSLLSACRTFASSHTCQLRARLAKDGAGGFRSPAVRADVDKMLHGAPAVGDGNPAPRKRSRRTL